MDAPRPDLPGGRGIHRRRSLHQSRWERLLTWQPSYRWTQRMRPRWLPRSVAPPGRGFSPRPVRGTGRTIALVAVVVFGFAIAGGGGTGAYYLPLLRGAIEDTGHTLPESTPRPHPRPSGPAAVRGAPTPAAEASNATPPFTVLLLGSDNDGKDGNNQAPLTQSVILVRVNPQAGTVVMLSLPRDLIINCYDSAGGVVGSEKLDACFEAGTFPDDAAAAMVQTIQDNFDIQVNDWAWIGLQGLVNLINYVGGVDVVVSSPVMDDLYPADLGTPNIYGYQRLAILPGPQHMTGAQALNYVRSRHESTYGDFSRSARQQQVLVALRDKLQYLNAADLPQIENAMRGQFYTSMTLTQLAALLPLAPRIKNGAVTQLTLASPLYTSDTEVTTDGQPDDVVIGNFGAIDDLIWRYFPQTGG